MKQFQDFCIFNSDFTLHAFLSAGAFHRLAIQMKLLPLCKDMRGPSLRYLGKIVCSFLHKSVMFERHHIATHSLSSPITSETVPLKFPENFQKFPKKLEALLLVAQLGTGNFYRF